MKFVIKDFKVKEDNGALTLRTEILSGEHSGKSYPLYIPPAENDIKRKQRAAFFYKSGIWSQAELDARDIKLARLINREIQGEAGKANAGKEEGVMFQDIMNIKDLGESKAPSATTEAGNAAVQTSF